MRPEGSKFQRRQALAYSTEPTSQALSPLRPETKIVFGGPFERAIDRRWQGPVAPYASDWAVVAMTALEHVLAEQNRKIPKGRFTAKMRAATSRR